MAPFLGVIGTTPHLPGLSSTHPPRRTGGNIDCRELDAGSTLLLPVECDGGLLLIGDGHAAQGDGEAGSTAIECPMRSVTLTVDLLPHVHLESPRAFTDEAWITFGFDESLDDAAHLALADMVSLVQELFGYGRAEAANVCSQIVDLRITQIVNGVKGVHAFLPRAALELLPVRRS
jgi:acetamidase/formamidase